MSDMLILKITLSIYARVWRARVKAFFFDLFNPNAPIELHDFRRVSGAIEKAFTARQRKVRVTEITFREFETIYSLWLPRGMKRLDINKSLPQIVEALNVEQWQVRPVVMPELTFKHCIAVMY